MLSMCGVLDSNSPVRQTEAFGKPEPDSGKEPELDPGMEPELEPESEPD